MASLVRPANGGKWTVEAALEHVLALIAERDSRYATQFDAQRQSIDAVLSLATARDGRYDAQFSGQKEAVAAALASADRAVLKAESASEKRFESVNEFRETLSDQQRNLMPRAEAEIRFKAIDDKLSILSSLNDIRGGKSSGTRDGWGYAAAVVGLIVGVAGFLLRR